MLPVKSLQCFHFLYCMIWLIFINGLFKPFQISNLIFFLFNFKLHFIKICIWVSNTDTQLKLIKSVFKLVSCFDKHWRIFKSKSKEYSIIVVIFINQAKPSQSVVLESNNCKLFFCEQNYLKSFWMHDSNDCLQRVFQVHSFSRDNELVFALRRDLKWVLDAWKVVKYFQLIMSLST